MLSISLYWELQSKAEKGKSMLIWIGHKILGHKISETLKTINMNVIDSNYKFYAMKQMNVSYKEKKVLLVTLEDCCPIHAHVD